MPSADIQDGNRCRLLELPAELLLDIIDLFTQELLYPVASRDKAVTYSALFALRWTCHSLRAATPDPVPRVNALRRTPYRIHRDDAIGMLLRLETWPAYCAIPEMLHTSNLPDPSEPQSAGGWTSKLRPMSRHACSICLLLVPSSQFAWHQISGPRAKMPTGISPSSSMSEERQTMGLGKATRRFCISCGIRSLQYTDKTPVIKVMQDWEGTGTFATGIVCKRCQKFIVTPAESATALRRKCESCRDYRPP